VLLIFGPKKLPEMGRSLGRGMREFKDSVTGKNDDEKQLEEPGSAQSAPVASPAPTTATTADEEARAKAAKPADASS
jgi:sec-independent protein translocase protein TatA